MSTRNGKYIFHCDKTHDDMKKKRINKLFILTSSALQTQYVNVTFFFHLLFQKGKSFCPHAVHVYLPSNEGNVRYKVFNVGEDSASEKKTL